MKHLALCCVMLMAGLSLAGCGDDEASGSDAGSDGGAGSVTDSGATKPGKDSGSATQDSAVDSGSDNDAGDGDAGETFNVPSGGGDYSFKTASGATVTFNFPASAAGKKITLESVDPSKVSWGNSMLEGAFSDAIVLGPSGTVFADPVEVTLEGGALIAFNFSDSDGVPDPLMLSGAGDSLELTHFSTLGIVAPGQSCLSESGWNDTADSQRCSAFGAASTFRSYGCKQYQFCYTIEAACCVEPGDKDTDCKVGDENLTLVYRRTGSNGGQFDYCDLAGGVGDAPYLQSVSPASLAGSSQPQVITLTGTGFTEDGTAFTNSDGPIPTTFVSSTQVTATVPGNQLQAVGTLSNVGFVNLSAQGTPGSGPYDWTLRSNMVNIPILAPDAACPTPGNGVGLRTITSAAECSLVMDYDADTTDLVPAVTYELKCVGGVCECLRDSTVSNDGAIGSTCTDKTSIEATWDALCMATAGFCP